MLLWRDPCRDLKRQHEALNLVNRHVCGAAGVDVSQDGSLVASGGADKAVRLLKLDEHPGVLSSTDQT